MIEFFDGSLLDILPVSWKTEETDAISAALQWCTQTLITLAKQTRLRADVDDLPERILDIMAVEMDAPYYSEALPLETKRDIIKRTICWHMHAGTPSVVKELLQVVFGSGDLIEWWEDPDDPDFHPFEFDLITSAQLTPDIMQQIANVLVKGKREAAHLRRLWIRREIRQALHIGAAADGNARIPIYSDSKRRCRHPTAEHVAAAFTNAPRTAVDNSVKRAGIKTAHRFTAGAAADSTKRYGIQSAGKKQRDMSAAIFVGAAISGSAKRQEIIGGSRTLAASTGMGAGIGIVPAARITIQC